MKSDRFCEILKEIAWTASLSPDSVPSPAELEDWVKTASGSAVSKQLTFVRISDGQGNPLSAYLTLEYLKDGMTVHFFKVPTNELGYAALRLEEGLWRITASKGACYSVDEKTVEIYKDQAVIDLQLLSIQPAWMKGWIAGDLHHHSVYSSRLFGGTDPVTESPAQIRNSMQAAGLQFGALSDHHNTLNHPAWQSCADADFLPVLSKENSTSAGHVMALNVNRDIVFQIPAPEQRTDDRLRKEFVRLTTAIREAGGIAQLNHPCDRQKAISWNPAWMDLITIFDMMEIWNGSKPLVQGTSSFAAVELWLTLLEQGIYLPATTGSDTHNTRCDDYSGYCRALFSHNCGSHPEAVQWKQLLDLFGRWQRQCLGSGGVFTMVCPRAFTVESVMCALKGGESVLSSGPLLLPSFGSAGPGQHASFAGDLTIRLRSNRPLRTLLLAAKGHRRFRYSLAPYETVGTGFWDYTHTITPAQMKEMGILPAPGDWLVVLAADEERYTAITNPIFLD